jgi:hypothetical protein
MGVEFGGMVLNLGCSSWCTLKLVVVAFGVLKLVYVEVGGVEVSGV